MCCIHALGAIPVIGLPASIGEICNLRIYKNILEAGPEGIIQNPEPDQAANPPLQDRINLLHHYAGKLEQLRMHLVCFLIAAIILPIFVTFVWWACLGTAIGSVLLFAGASDEIRRISDFFKNIPVHPPVNQV